MRPLLYLCGLLFMVFGTTGSAEAPFVLEKTPGKLPKAVLPLRYVIRLQPDIEKAMFTGTETVFLDVRQPIRQIVLHAAGLEISEARLRATQQISLTPKLDAAEQTLTFDLDAELPAGRYELTLRFTGKLTEQPRGLYISRYQAGGVTGRALVTQMEAIDCRRMFPCWDEPVFRAEFELTAVVPEKLRAVSNMPITAEKPVGEGWREVAFAPTPKMASYLVALAVGDFEEVRDELDGIQLAVLTTPGKREQARYALDATKKILSYYHEYFGLKYPLPKLDQLAIPSTGAGAMENWGCIIYNDNTLLYDPAASAQSTREHVFAVVAHEIAHQWFGNLVTMAWWDNLWLNEGFASWMGTKVTNDLNPDWKVWLRAAGSKERAMRLDARATTHPIQQPVPSDMQATEGFDEITYQKGQSVLRMIESWLGEAPFRDGIRAYLQAHAYSNSTTADLWQALEKVSGQPVRSFAAGWTEQPGFPVVTLSVLPEGSNASVQLEQERFTIHQKNPAPLEWQIPVIYGPAGAPHRAVLALLKNHVQPGAAFDPETALKGNIGDVGYYRVAYDATLAKRLRKAAPHLAEADRLNALNDAWVMVQAGRASAEDYLHLAAALSDDRSPTVLGQMIGVLHGIDELERGTKNREGFRAWAREFLRPNFERITWETKPGESPLDADLRASLIRTLGLFGDEDVISSARARFAAYLTDPASLPGDLREPVFSIVGKTADATTWEQLHHAARQEDSFEQKRALYGALVSARNPALAAQTLALSLTDELIAPDAARLVHRVADDGEHPELAWAFAREHLDALLAKVPALAANNYIPRLFEAFDDVARADELEAFAKKNLPPAVGTAVAKAADNIRFQAEFKARVLPQIDAWWQARVAR
jgi:aminopeptidase N